MIFISPPSIHRSDTTTEDAIIWTRCKQRPDPETFRESSSSCRSNGLSEWVGWRTSSLSSELGRRGLSTVRDQRWCLPAAHHSIWLNYKKGSTFKTFHDKQRPQRRRHKKAFGHLAINTAINAKNEVWATWESVLSATWVFVVPEEFLTVVLSK